MSEGARDILDLLAWFNTARSSWFVDHVPALTECVDRGFVEQIHGRPGNEAAFQITPAGYVALREQKQ